MTEMKEFKVGDKVVYVDCEKSTKLLEEYHIIPSRGRRLKGRPLKIRAIRTWDNKSALHLETPSGVPSDILWPAQAFELTKEEENMSIKYKKGDYVNILEREDVASLFYDRGPTRIGQVTFHENKPEGVLGIVSSIDCDGDLLVYPVAETEDESELYHPSWVTPYKGRAEKSETEEPIIEETSSETEIFVVSWGDEDVEVLDSLESAMEFSRKKVVSSGEVNLYKTVKIKNFKLEIAEADVESVESEKIANVLKEIIDPSNNYKFKIGDKVRAKKLDQIDKARYEPSDEPGRSVAIDYSSRLINEEGVVHHFDSDNDVWVKYGSGRKAYHPSWLELIEETK